MAEYYERRQAPRIAVANGITLRAPANLLFEVRLLDLSLIGARIAHLELLRPGSPSALEFPAMLGPLTLASQIARTRIVGTQPNLFGERQHCYESGFVFLKAPAEQRANLADILASTGFSPRAQAGELSF